MVFFGRQVASLQPDSAEPSPLQRQNLPRFRSDEAITLTQYELLTHAKNQFERAAKYFKQVNHWRGLYNVYRSLDLLADMHLGTQVSNDS